MQNLTKNFLPNIYLDKEIKQALLLQLVSKEPFNILFVGDPYTGKSTILREMTKLKEKASYFSGTLFSDILTPKKVLIKEGLEKTDLLCLDDIDSCTGEDRAALKDILQSDISILAAGNPKFGRFDPYGLIIDQIDLTARMVSSFNLIFPLKDIPDKEKDKKLVNLIFEKKKTILLEKVKEALQSDSREVNINKNLQKKITDYYLDKRRQKNKTVICIGTTLRNVQTLIKLTKATAFLNQRKEANEEDFNVARNILDYCLGRVAEDIEEREIDMDRISSAGLTALERKNLKIVSDAIDRLSGKIISVEDVVREAEHLGLKVEVIEEMIERLRRANEIYEPKSGFITRMVF